MVHKMRGPVTGPSHNSGIKDIVIHNVLPTDAERDRNRKWQAADRVKHPERHMEASSRNREWRAARAVRQSKRRRRIRR